MRQRNEVAIKLGIISLPSSQKYEDSNEKQILGTPPTPLKKPILGGQKPKWAVSHRRVCTTVLEFCMGS